MAKPIDAIIIGAGHNGLVTAAYLARAGLHLYPKDPSFFTAFPDNRHLFFWQDLAATQRELAKFSKRDAESYPDYEHRLARLAEWVEGLLIQTPPNIIRRKLGDLIALGRMGLDALRFSDTDTVHLIKIMTQSVRAYLDERFESEHIKATLATDGVIGTNGGPSTPGTAYIMLHHVMGGATGTRGLWGFARGGMGAISQAIADSARAHGATVRTGAAISHILIR